MAFYLMTFTGHLAGGLESNDMWRGEVHTFLSYWRRAHRFSPQIDR